MRPDSARNILQVLAILGLIAMFSVILHKGVSDLWALAQIHEGGAFWSALGRYFIANLAS